MNLEDVFCEIKTDCCNIAHGWRPLLVIFDDHHLGTSMPSGGHPPHQLAASSFAHTRRFIFSSFLGGGRYSRSWIGCLPSRAATRSFNSIMVSQVFAIPMTIQM